MTQDPVFEVVADHRWDRQEKRQGAPMFPGGPPSLRFVTYCRCGKHSEAVSSPGVANQWHDVHLERVMKGEDNA